MLQRLLASGTPIVQNQGHTNLPRQTTISSPKYNAYPNLATYIAIGWCYTEVRAYLYLAEIEIVTACHLASTPRCQVGHIVMVVVIYTPESVNANWHHVR